MKPVFLLKEPKSTFHVLEESLEKLYVLMKKNSGFAPNVKIQFGMASIPRSSIASNVKRNIIQKMLNSGVMKQNMDVVKYPRQRFEYLLSLIRVTYNINILVL